MKYKAGGRYEGELFRGLREGPGSAGWTRGPGPQHSPDSDSGPERARARVCSPVRCGSERRAHSEPLKPGDSGPRSAFALDPASAVWPGLGRAGLLALLRVAVARPALWVLLTLGSVTSSTSRGTQRVRRPHSGGSERSSPSPRQHARRGRSSAPLRGPPRGVRAPSPSRACRP